MPSPRVLLPFAALLACTGWSPPAREHEPVPDVPWQSRCGAALRGLVAGAANQHPILAGARIGFHTLHGDNFTYFTVTMRAGSGDALALDLSRHDPPIPDEASAGWQPDARAPRPTWKRNTALAAASLVVPDRPGAATILPIVQRAADVCLDDSSAP